LSSPTTSSQPTPTGTEGTEIFARANPESVEIEETFEFVQEISRNRSVGHGPDDPTGRITISLPYDGDECFTRDAVKDVEQHLQRRGSHDGDIEALIGHLVLANYQDTNLPDPAVLNLTGRFGVVPLRLPVRSPDLGDIQDLVSDRHEYRYEVKYAPAADRPKIIPIQLSVDLEDPDNADLPEIDPESDPDKLDYVAKKIMEYVGFRPMLVPAQGARHRAIAARFRAAGSDRAASLRGAPDDHLARALVPTAQGRRGVLSETRLAAGITAGQRRDGSSF